MSQAELPTPSREGFLNGETAITSLNGGLFYRGYQIGDMVAESNFLETAFAIVHGDLPSQEQFADMQAVMTESSVLDGDIAAWIDRLPLNVPAIDVLRTGICLLALSDALSQRYFLPIERPDRSSQGSLLG